MEESKSFFISKEFNKAGRQFNIKSLLSKHDKKKFVYNDKPNISFNLDYDDKNDIIELFHENENDKISFFKDNILNLLQKNIYTKYTTKKEKQRDKKGKVYDNLIHNLLNQNKNKKKLLYELKLNNSRNIRSYYKYNKKINEKGDQFKELGLTRKTDQKPEIIYYPNYDYIQKRIISGPMWMKISGREKNKNKNNRNQNLSFLSNRKPFNNQELIIPKTNKTQRNINKFYLKNIYKNTNKDKLSIKTDSKEKEKIKDEILNINTKNNKSNSQSSMKNMKKFYKSKSLFDFNNIMLNKQIWNEYNKLYTNYFLSKERTKNMVNYKKIHLNSRRVKDFKGCRLEEFIDPLKAFKKSKGEKNSGLIFDKMSSRSHNKMLPSFMSGIHSRIALDINMDESLKMNNYSRGNFMKDIDFFTERSFNKYINLSMLKSEYMKSEKLLNLSEFIYLANNFRNADNNKNNLDLNLEEIKLKNFDKITFKSLNLRKNKKNKKTFYS